MDQPGRESAPPGPLTDSTLDTPARPGTAATGSLGQEAISGRGRVPLLKHGDTAGNCTIEKFLAFGGMGEVYIGRHKTLERSVAIKLVREKHDGDPKYRARFLREAKAAARLVHPNIGVIFDAGETAGGRLFVVMEYVEGEDLAQRITRLGALAPNEALRYARDLARALAAAHAEQIVHRDVKPSNVMITPEGTAKLMDFGLARLLDTHELDKTETGAVVGTPQYMSPEQWNGAELDGRSDLFSLGVTLYESLCGKWPVSGSTIGQICSQVTTHQLVPLRQRHPGLAPEICSLVDWLLAPLETRCPDAESLAERLDELLGESGARRRASSWQHESGPAPAAVSGMHTGEPDVAESTGERARPWIWGAVAAGLLLVGLGLVFAGGREEPKPAPLKRDATEATTPPELSHGTPGPGEIASTSAAETFEVTLSMTGMRSAGEAKGQLYDALQTGTVHSGDLLKFSITPQASGYLYVIWLQSQGEPLLLWPPQPGAPPRSVEAHQSVFLPEVPTDWYELDRHTGVESFYVLASREPLADLETQLRQWTVTTRGTGAPPDTRPLLDAVQRILGEQPEDLTRGLAGVKKGKPVRIRLPNGQEVERLGEALSGQGVVVKKVDVEHK